MERKQRYWLILVSLLIPFTLVAARVDADAARAVAREFVASRSQGTTLKAANVSMTLSHVELTSWNASLVDYYIFNTTDGKGFVIVSGDDRAEQVLGYGDGNIDMTDIPCGLQWLLDTYKEQLEYLHAHPLAVVETSSQTLKSSGVQYLPLLTSDWSQSEPYYNQCPLYEGVHCVTGCIATAMAQVMYFWRYPQSSPTVRGYRLPWMQLPDLPPTTFEWDDMLDRYTGYYTEAQGEAVAKLMRYCGQACSMDYGVDGSGAYVHTQLAALKLMNYNPGATMVEKKNYSVEDWNSMMLRELESGYPLLYSGSGQAGGHSFVLDGYDGNQGKYHINWGWAAKGNGYFALGAFNVRDYTFNSQQQMLLMVHPATTPEIAQRYDFEVDGIYYKIGDNDDDAVVSCKDTRYNSYSGNVMVPEHVTWKGRTLAVTAVGKDAFRDCDNLYSVTLPNSVKLIDERAFRSASRMTEVVMPGQLESIGALAFTNCISLERVYLPSSVREIGYHAFLNCTGLNRVDVDNVQSWIDIALEGYYSSPLLYAHRLFAGGQEVKHLVIPNSTVSLPDYKFAGFSGMDAVSFNEELVSIGTSTFEGCSSLSSLDFPESLTTIGLESFKDCTGLQDLVLTESFQHIGQGAFKGCNSVKSVDFKGAVDVIETDAFDGCENLISVMTTDLGSWFDNGFQNEKSNPLSIAHRLYVNGEEITGLVIPDDISSIGDYLFYGFSGMTSLTMGNNVEKIGKSAFAQCKGLTQLTIGEGVTAIGEKAFSTCSNLQSVVIGSNVQSIADKAFIACLNMTDVTCRPLVPPVAANVMWFSNATCSKAVLMVSRDVVAAYKKANEWNRFSEIVGIEIHDDLKGDVNIDGEINIADVNVLVDVIFADNRIKTYHDVNGDGEVNIADVNAIIDMILTPR